MTSLEDDAPIHSETGFFRPQSDDSIELVLAHSFGAVEIEEGRINGTQIEMHALQQHLDARLERMPD